MIVRALGVCEVLLANWARSDDIRSAGVSCRQCVRMMLLCVLLYHTILDVNVKTVLLSYL